MNKTLRQLGLRGVAVVALLAISATPGLTSLPRAHASCGGWQYISMGQTNGIDIYLIRDACNNTFAYSDNAPAQSEVWIFQGTQNLHAVGSGPLQSPSYTIQCGQIYYASIATQNYGSTQAPGNSGHTYC
jgi:hypothetical protein